MKKLLFVINTLGHAGAETAFIELLKAIPKESYETDIYVLLKQGEMKKRLPEGAKLLNTEYSEMSVLSKEGQRALKKTVIAALLRHGNIVRLMPYMLSILIPMMKNHRIQIDKLLWRAVSDGADRFSKEYDLAVAFLEGASTYYVAEHVNAKKKAAFMHVDYERAGYTRKMDRDAYLSLDRIFAVSGEVRDSLVRVYPECADRTEIFHNILDVEGIRKKAKEGRGFEDGFDGTRILTVGRLNPQKALEISVEAMLRIKKEYEGTKKKVRWYVLGEGPEREKLTVLIDRLGLKDDFILMGAVENPYPYIAEADIYIHASRYEGKSIAVQEAQILAKPIIVSDCEGNREQVENERDGIICGLDAEEIKDCAVRLMEDEEFSKAIGNAAYRKNENSENEIERLLGLA